MGERDFYFVRENRGWVLPMALSRTCWLFLALHISCPLYSKKWNIPKTPMCMWVKGILYFICSLSIVFVSKDSKSESFVLCHKSVKFRKDRVKNSTEMVANFQDISQILLHKSLHTTLHTDFSKQVHPKNASHSKRNSPIQW